jgi:hypothetical protein
MDFSLEHGYAWRSWHRIMSAKIPKRAGNLLLDKLRTIHLMEPDFNWLQGLTIGRRMIKNTNRLNPFTTTSGGAALDATLLAQLC